MLMSSFYSHYCSSSVRIEFCCSSRNFDRGLAEILLANAGAETGVRGHSFQGDRRFCAASIDLVVPVDVFAVRCDHSVDTVSAPLGGQVAGCVDLMCRTRRVSCAQGRAGRSSCISTAAILYDLFPLRGMTKALTDNGTRVTCPSWTLAGFTSKWKVAHWKSVNTSAVLVRYTDLAQPTSAKRVFGDFIPIDPASSPKRRKRKSLCQSCHSVS